MASVGSDKNGSRRIVFATQDGKRLSIRLGKVSQRTAETVKWRVEQLLEGHRFNRPMEAALAEWVAGLEPQFAKKLGRTGLIPANEAKPQLGPFLADWLASRKGDYKPASLIAWGQVTRALVRSFGDSCPLAEITPAKAEQFRQSMIAAGLRPTTIHKRIAHARSFFAFAKRGGLVSINPFEFVKHRQGDPSERRAYVPSADALRAIEYAPDGDWRLLIALSRFGGLRIPSEAFSLRWQDVDWERGRILVPSPKTEHMPGRAFRAIPLFPEIRPYLEAAWDRAPEGSVYVMPEKYRLRAQGPGGWRNANLRTTLGKILRRAGLESWPRLWHSMRASCETDLARRFPLAVVCKWIGNTQAVALRHYVDVTDADFERAANEEKMGDEKTVQKAAQQVPVWSGTGPQPKKPVYDKPLILQGFASTRETLQNKGMEARGIEPPHKTRGKQGVGPKGSAKSGTLCARLEELVQAWPGLLPETQRRILTLAGLVEADQPPLVIRN